MTVKKITFKGLLSIILAILMALPSAAIISFAEDREIVEEGACGAYSTYTLDENGLLTIGGSGSVNSYAFYERTDVKALEVGDKITSFGPHAFNGCSELESISLGEKVRSIGEKAFYGVAAETLELPDSVTTIGSLAFADSGLKNLIIGEGVRSVNWNIVSGCPLKDLTVYSYRLDLDVKIPSDVTLHAYHYSYAMDYAAQMGMKREALDEHEFEEVYTSDSTCGKDGFTVELCSCGEYKSEVIPATEHVDADSNNVCDNCGKYLGVLCDHDYEITITKPTCTENGVAHMVCRLCLDEQNAVIEATGHEYKFSDEGLMCAFCGENYNYEAVLAGYPIRTDSIGPNATYTIYSTGEFIVNGSGPIERGTIGSWGSTATKIIIIGAITEIGDGTFDYFNKVTDVEIKSSKLTRIGNNAFNSCYALKSINIPASVVEIGDDAFRGDSNLESITFPKGLEKIGGGAFFGCGKLNCKEIVLTGATSIGNDAFKGCSLIESIRIERADCVIGSGAIPQAVTIIGHKDSTAKTYALANGNKFDQIEIEEGDCGEAKYILYNSGTLYIYGNGEAGYFRNDLRIKKVVVAEGVTALSKLCFSGCTNIKEVTLYPTVKKIGDNAFEYCEFDTLVIPDSVVELGKYALKGTSLNKLVIGHKLLSADAKTFQYAEIKNLEVRNTKFDPAVGNFRDAVITAPHGSAAYKYALDWGNEFRFNDNHTLVTLAQSQATCGAYGEKFVYCTGCDFYEVQKINPTKHVDADNDVVCDVCGKLLKEICEHNFEVDYVRDRCGKEGYCNVRCLNCDFRRALLTDFTEHNGVTYIKGFRPSTVGNEGYTGDVYCLLCDEMVFKGKTTGKLVDPEVIAYRTECIDKLQALLEAAKHETSVSVLEDAIETIRNLDEKTDITNEYNSAVAEYDYYEELLSTAVKNAVAEIETAAGENRSDVITFIVDETEMKISSSTNEKAVESAKNEGLDSIKTQLAKELADAKSAAIKAIEAAAGENYSVVVAQIIGLGARDITLAKTIESVNTIKENTIKAINAQLAKEADAKALADAKAAAIAEITALLKADSTDAEKALVNEAVEVISNATSIQAVENAKADFYSKWEALHNSEDPTDPEDPTKTCGHMCHKGGFIGFIWKIVKFFSKLFGTNKICSCGVKHY